MIRNRNQYYIAILLFHFYALAFIFLGYVPLPMWWSALCQMRIHQEENPPKKKWKLAKLLLQITIQDKDVRQCIIWNRFVAVKC